MRLFVGVPNGSYTFNTITKTVVISGVGTATLTLANILAIIHPGSGQLLYQVGNPLLTANTYTPAAGGGTLVLNATVSTAGMNNSDPLDVIVEADIVDRSIGGPDSRTLTDIHNDLLAPLPAGTNSIGKVNPTNFTTVFRDGFDVFPSANWTIVTGSGDIVRADGNATGASYAVISKDPLSQGTLTSMTSNVLASLPVELSVGAHMSQRTLGQEFALEMVSNDAPAGPFTDLAISAIQQATTTLTVTTATAHGLACGNSVTIYGVSDSRLNYPAIVVASIPTPFQFTCTAGPSGNIPSVTAGPFASGMVTVRPRLGFAPSGTSLIFENSNGTNGSFYARSNAGDALPSGTAIGNHSVAVGSTTSAQPVNSAFTNAFRPTSEFRLALMADRTQWYGTTVDATTQATNYQTWTQVIPDLAKQYTFRIRALNNKSLTVPVAKIVSMQKTGTTTATVTTDVAHGLTTADLIVVYGSSDPVAYANLTTATAVASVINSTQFTVVIGTAVTSTVYGGYVARVNGGNLMSSLGAIAQAATAAVLATAADGTQALTLTGSAAWFGLLIGDYVNVHGLRSVPGTGADLGCDGAWVVRNVSGTALELGPIGSTVPPANFGSTVSGGAVIKRTDLRISFVRLFDFDRTRVEMLTRPSGDTASATPVVIQNGSMAVTTNNASVSLNQINSSAAVTGGLAGTLAIGGAAAHSSATTTNPATVGGRVLPTTAATVDTTLAANDASFLPITTGYQVAMKPYGTAELDWSAVNSFTPTLWSSATTPVRVRSTSGVAGVRTYITGLQISTDLLGGSSMVWLLDGVIGVSSASVATPGVFTSTTHDFKVDDAVVFQNAAGLVVTGASNNQVVYIASVPNATTFTVSLTPGGPGVQVTASGTASIYRILKQIRLQGAILPPTPMVFQTPLRTAPNVALSLLCHNTQTGVVYVDSQGYYGF